MGVPAEAVAANQGWIGSTTVGLVNVLSGWLGADDDPYNPRGFRIPARDILLDLRLQDGRIKGVPSPFQNKTFESPDGDVTLHYNIDPLIVTGRDQGGT